MDTLDLIKVAAAAMTTAVGCTWVLRSKLSSIESKLVRNLERTDHHEARIANHDARLTKLEDVPAPSRRRSKR